jgi:hypothetical protein
VHHLGDHGERAHRPRADARNQQKLGEVGGTALRGGREGTMQAADHYIARPHIVMCRHHEMRQQRQFRRLRLECGDFADDAIRADIAEKVELAPP